MQYLSQRLAAQSTRSRGGKSPPGPVAASQRNRLLEATERLVAERGCAGTTIEGIVKAARVASVTFYEHFDSKEECLVAAFDRAVGQTLERLREAAPEGLPWPERIRSALAALLELVAADPARARMCLVEAQMGGPALLARYEEALDSAALKLREGRALDTATGLADTAEEAIVGGVAWLLRDRLERDGAEGIEAMLPALVEIAVSPYVDGGANERVAEVLSGDV